MPKDPTPQTPTLLSEYAPPDWLIERTSLVFDLAPSATRVRSTLSFVRNGAADADLVLAGRNLSLVAAAIDGEDVLDRVRTDRESLRLSGPLPDRFEWTAEVEIDPASNTELEGLYLSKGMYCTQCEAEGFRKITYYPDRPDVMTVFDVRIEADIKDAPVLLSNGNPVAKGRLAGGRHFAEWHDPHPKPSYLFALVAGDLVAHEDKFTTASGRDVALQIWVREGDEKKCAYAMDVLKRSMKWDEQVYGREYDLDLFMVVAVDDFNMGAMENKGLNIFNSKYVLASPETATDQDYANIEAIIAHEYFHNWTGNRITCRDWFQLCLKEGLTVFRDQQFSADMRSAAVQRIGDVKTLRSRQFREDAGPLAHPVRPESYIEINNFYTATVYEKGAEVIRMLHTLIGPETFRAGTDLYFERHDGQACTIEDWLAVFEDVSGRDLSQFARWYSQAGTPELSVEEDWDETDGVLTVTFRQALPDTPGQAGKSPQVIPVATGLIGPGGNEVMATEVLEVTKDTQTFRFSGLDARPVASYLRGFSAPVMLEREIDDETRGFLLAHDTDPFSRWEAGHQYAISVALGLVDGKAVPEAWTEALGRVLADQAADPAFKALVLSVPSEDEMAAALAHRGHAVDPAAVATATRIMRETLGRALRPALERTYDTMDVPGPYSPDAEAAGRRALRNQALSLLAAAGEAGVELADRQSEADNMSEVLPALRVLVVQGATSADARLEEFHDRWKDDPLVIDKWLTLQATTPRDDALDRVISLTEHPSFDWKNPNKFRALIGAFAMANPTGFHRPDGAGYRFVTDWLLRLDPVNPQTTARLAGVFETWHRYTPDLREMMKAEMERMAAVEGLSKNTREIIERMLPRS